MKWLDDIRYKLWWRGIYAKDLAMLMTIPTSFIALIIFVVYTLIQGM